MRLYRIPVSSSRIQSASSLTNDLVSKLSSCPSDFYVIVEETSVHAVDYSRPANFPFLRKKVSGNDESIASSFMVNEVLGVVDVGRIEDTLKNKCGAERAGEFDGPSMVEPGRKGKNL